MKDEQERLLAHMITFFDRTGTWFLEGETLRDFTIGHSIFRSQKLRLGLLDVDQRDLRRRCQAFGTAVRFADDKVKMDIGHHTLSINMYSSRANKATYRAKNVPLRWLVAPDKERKLAMSRGGGSLSTNGTWRYSVDPILPYSLPCPYGSGALLDEQLPLWFVDVKRPKVDADKASFGNLFFTPKRKKNAARLLEAMFRLGRQAGLEENMFLAFGALLGIVRGGDFIPHDTDLDLNIFMTKDGKAEKRYYKLLEKPGSFAPDKKDPDHWRTMFEKRKRGPEVRKDNGVPVWLSLGPLGPKSENGVKSCNWFWFEFNGYSWHSKGRKWVRPKKFDGTQFAYTSKDQAIAKGIPSPFVADRIPFMFHGVQVRIPRLAGTCLDWWYPGWMRPAKGSSAKKQILVIGKWGDQRTWRMV